MIAALGMYDWPELRHETDMLWQSMVEAFADIGINSPEKLSRDLNCETLWLHNDLLIAQCCGLPFVSGLADQVCLLTTPIYSIECEPGFYFSHICVASDHSAKSLNDINPLSVAVNSKNSLSGNLALMQALNPNCAPSITITGSHRQSLHAVAKGHCEVAAIDAVCWELALAYEPCRQKLRSIGKSRTYPGLPFITAKRFSTKREIMADAIKKAINRLSLEIRTKLMLEGTRDLSCAVYQNSIAPTLGATRSLFV